MVELAKIHDVSLAPAGALRGGMPTRDRRALLYLASLLLDCLALILAYLVTLQTNHAQWLAIAHHAVVYIALPIFVMFEIAREVQSVEALSSRSLGLLRALSALGATALAIVLADFLVKDANLSRVGFTQFFGLSAIGLMGSKWFLDWLVDRFLDGKITGEILVCDGVKIAAPSNMSFVDTTSLGLWPDLARPDYIDALSRIVAPYDRVVVACVPEHRDAWAMFLKASDVGGEILVDQSALYGAVAIGACGDGDTLVLSRGPLSFTSRLQKRTFDLVLGVPLTLVALPLMALVALAIRLESPGPIFFMQVRVGQGNRQFRMFKFRSMRTDCTDSDGNRSASREDDRVTRVGRIIRRTSVDELPQLFNVLRGDMSLVGPRPHALGSTAGSELFWEVSASYWLRHSLKPGITGLAQIRGFRGSTSRPEDLKKRLRADLEYVTTWSVWSDATILLRTVLVMTHKNAF